MDNPHLMELVTERGIDSSSVRMLIDHGKRMGSLTISEIVDCVPEAEWDEELKSELVAAVVAAGIQFVEGSLGPAPTDDDFKAAEQPEIDFANLEEETAGANLEDVETDDMLKLYIKEASQTPLLTHAEEVELARRIEQAQAAQQELAQNGNSGERKGELQRQIQTGRSARERLIRANARLVISVARKYIGRGMPFLDLIQEGNIGLMRAVRNFDYHRGFKFSTYATWWIRQAVSRALAEQSRTIRLPVHMSDQVGRMLREQNRLHQELGRKPNSEELADALNVTPDKVDHMLDVVRQPLSLQTPVGEEDDEVLGDFVEDTEAGDPEEMVSDLLMNEELSRMLEKLPERELEVLILRYGLEGNKPLTLNEVGVRLGITRERVRQLEMQAIERLRNPNAPHRRSSAGKKPPASGNDPAKKKPASA